MKRVCLHKALRQWATVAGLVMTIVVPQGVGAATPSAAPVSSPVTVAPGWRIQLPEGWEVRRQFMGVDLMARPGLATDPEGWGQDLLVVARQPASARQTLDASAQRSLRSVAHHASQLQVLAQRDVKQGARKGRWMHLRMKDGPEVREGQLLVLQDAGQVVSLLVTTSPQRFAARQNDLTRLLGIAAP